MASRVNLSPDQKSFGQNSNENEVICQICDNNLQEDPHTLCCYQNFCGECLFQIDELKLGGDHRDSCCVCKIFKDDDKESTNLLKTVKDGMDSLCKNELVWKIKDDISTCSQCESSNTIAYCVNCDSSLCNICQYAHFEEINSQGHQVIAKGNIHNSLVINVVRMCRNHPNLVIKTHCKTCELSICTQCNEEMHETHAKESVEEAMLRCVSEVKAGLMKIHSNCTLAREICKVVKLINKTTHTNYENIIQQAKEAMEMKKSIIKMSNDADQEKIEGKISQLHVSFMALENFLFSQQPLQNGKVLQSDLEHKVSCMQKLCTWVNVLTTITQGSGTLYELESNLVDKVVALSNEKNCLVKAQNFIKDMPQKAKFVAVSDGVNVGNVEFIATAENFVTKPAILRPKNELGTIFDKNNTEKIENGVSLLNNFYRKCDSSIRELSKKTISLVKSIKYKHHVIRLCVFSNHLWCATAFDDNCIEVYNFECEHVRTIYWNRVVRSTNSIHPHRSKEMLIAASNGLFVMDVKTAAIVNQILPGNIKDVHCDNDTIAALEQGGHDETVHILSATPPYIPLAGFPLSNNHHARTLLLHEQHVYISFKEADGGIIKYSLDGEQLAQINNKDIQQPNEPFTPYLGMIDDEGSLLVAEGESDRLLLLTEGDQSEVTGLQLKYPRDVVIVGEHMYVSRLTGLHKYKIM